MISTPSPSNGRGMSGVPRPIFSLPESIPLPNSQCSKAISPSITQNAEEPEPEPGSPSPPSSSDSAYNETPRRRRHSADAQLTLNHRPSVPRPRLMPAIHESIDHDRCVGDEEEPTELQYDHDSRDSSDRDIEIPSYPDILSLPFPMNLDIRSPKMKALPQKPSTPHGVLRETHKGSRERKRMKGSKPSMSTSSATTTKTKYSKPRRNSHHKLSLTPTHSNRRRAQSFGNYQSAHSLLQPDGMTNTIKTPPITSSAPRRERERRSGRAGERGRGKGRGIGSRKRSDAITSPTAMKTMEVMQPPQSNGDDSDSDSSFDDFHFDDNHRRGDDLSKLSPSGSAVGSASVISNILRGSEAVYPLPVKPASVGAVGSPLARSVRSLPISMVGSPLSTFIVGAGTPGSMNTLSPTSILFQPQTTGKFEPHKKYNSQRSRATTFCTESSMYDHEDAYDPPRPTPRSTPDAMLWHHGTSGGEMLEDTEHRNNCNHRRERERERERENVLGQTFSSKTVPSAMVGVGPITGTVITPMETTGVKGHSHSHHSNRGSNDSRLDSAEYLNLIRDRSRSVNVSDNNQPSSKDLNNAFSMVLEHGPHSGSSTNSGGNTTNTTNTCNGNGGSSTGNGLHGVDLDVQHREHRQQQTHQHRHRVHQHVHGGNQHKGTLSMHSIHSNVMNPGVSALSTTDRGDSHQRPRSPTKRKRSDRGDVRSPSPSIPSRPRSPTKRPRSPSRGRRSERTDPRSPSTSKSKGIRSPSPSKSSKLRPRNRNSNSKKSTKSSKSSKSSTSCSGSAKTSKSKTSKCSKSGHSTLNKTKSRKSNKSHSKSQVLPLHESMDTVHIVSRDSLQLPFLPDLHDFPSNDTDGTMIRVKRPMTPKKRDSAMRNVRIIRRDTMHCDTPTPISINASTKRIASKRKTLKKKRNKHQTMQRRFQPSLTMLSEFTTLSDDAPSSRSNTSQHQRSMDSCDMAFREYIGTEYGIVTDGMLTGESAVTSTDDTLYYDNEEDSAEEEIDDEDEIIMEDVESSVVSVEAPCPSETSETTDDFIQLMDMEEYDGKFRLALQQAYERGFNKGYSMGVQFNATRKEQRFPQRMLSR